LFDCNARIIPIKPAFVLCFMFRGTVG